MAGKLIVILVFSICILLPFSSAKSTDFYYCNKKANYAVKVSGVDITPYPVKGGKEATFSIAATTDDNISSGKLIIDVKYLFLHVHHETRDICKETSCPVSGDFVLSHSQAVTWNCSSRLVYSYDENDGWKQSRIVMHNLWLQYEFNCRIHRSSRCLSRHHC